MSAKIVSQTCVVIPAYQAEPAIGAVVAAIVAQGLRVIVVDDASRDRTALTAQEAGAQVIRRQMNGGKGTALRGGLQAAMEQGYAWVLTMDADGQHLPTEIPYFLETAARGEADIILGDRMSNPRGMPLERRFTNWFLSSILSSVVGQQIPDTQCGFRMVSRQVLERLNLSADRFEIESELVVKGVWAGFRQVSVPVSSVYRRSLSFIHPLGDTLRFFRFLLSVRRHNHS